ncbi:hypothetical protein HY312_02495 [Candidatus Saccharibacteria bacterium]|nr:hypothetical protein [Candidatus Saccharibacteria bacterium]
MRLLRQRIYITSLAAILTVGLGATISTPANALSLGDVTNALGGILGINNSKSETTPAAQKTEQKTPTAQPAQSSTPTAQSAQATTVPPTTTANAQQPSVGQTTSSQLSATPVQRVETVTPATRDTGTIVKQVASAQTTKSIAPVSYPSNRISTELRDELFAAAAVITIIGAASYGMTFAAAASPVPAVSRRPLYVK